MAFMMPVMKNDYKIYPSCPSSRGGSGTQSRNSIMSGSSPQSRDSILSSSPGAASFTSSPRHSRTPALHRMPKSESQSSLTRFHSKLLDKLRKTFRGKDESSSDDINQASTSITVR